MYKLGLIGYPIRHSLSPWIHQHLLERADIKGDYSLFEISPEDSFEDKINELKEQDIDGFNVTVPYKQQIIPFLDELDEVAKEMQAVNTVVYRDGLWIGYNTDGVGYVRSLESTYPDIFQKDKHVLLIGAGGAARAIYFALSRRGVANIDIANRTLEKAEDIAKLGKDNTNTVTFTLEEANRSLHQYDLIVQTTSVGMKNTKTESIITINQLKPGCIVSDIVYQPIRTKVLEDAEAHQARLLFGHAMLLYQAQRAFEIWTGELVDVTDLEQQLLEELKGR